MKNKYILIICIFLIYVLYGYFEVPKQSIQTTVNINKNVLCSDLISEYETKFNEQNINRSINIRLATSKINNIMILPGEIFSYNEIVGARTEENGFKLAHIYKEGKIVDGIGGGVCQISSTLYNACLYANLEIIERRSHQFMPSYIEAGRDAAVSDGYIDFKFRNTREYPIKIICIAENGILKCQIYGTKGENEYNIDIQTIITEYLPYKTIYQIEENNNLENQTVIQQGKNGFKCNVYKIIKKDGKILSKVIVSNNTYNAIDEIMCSN